MHESIFNAQRHPTGLCLCAAGSISATKSPDLFQVPVKIHNNDLGQFSLAISGLVSYYRVCS